MGTKAIVTIDDTFENIENEMSALGFCLEKRPNEVYHIKPVFPDKRYPTNQQKDMHNNYVYGELLKINPLLACSYILNAAVLRRLSQNQYRLVIANNGKPGLTEYHERLADNFFTESDQQNI